MVDVVSKAKRSKMMAGIKGKDTKPEILLRKELYARGFRYRLHDKGIKGKPDIVLRKYNALVFVHGCFWHGHENCKLFRLPKSRVKFWEEKIGCNMARDKKRIRGLLEEGWRVPIVWECAVKGKRDKMPLAVDIVEGWLLSGDNEETIRMDNKTGLPIKLCCNTS